VHAHEHRDVATADTRGHQQQGLGPPGYPQFGLRRAQRCLDRFTLLGAERQGLRPRTGVRTIHPRFRVDHAPALPQPLTSGQIFAERH